MKSECEWVGEGGRLRFDPEEGSSEIGRGGKGGQGREARALERANGRKGKDAKGREEGEEEEKQERRVLMEHDDRMERT